MEYAQCLYILLLLAILVYLVKLVFTYKSQIHKQHLKLIEYHLDKQLITKLVENVIESDTNSLGEIVTLIKNYYQLEDLLFYDIASDAFINLPDASNSINLVKAYIQKNRHAILEKAKKCQLIIRKLNNNACNLYILHSNYHQKLNNDMLVIFVKDKLISLEKHELSMMKTVINDILALLLRRTNQPFA